MKKIVIRALSGAVYVGLIVASILCVGGKFFPLLCTVFALMAVFEFDRLVSAHSPRPDVVRIFDAILCVVPPLYLAVPVLVPAADIYITTFVVALLYAAVIMIRMIYTLYSREEHPVNSLALRARLSDATVFSSGFRRKNHGRASSAVWCFRLPLALSPPLYCPSISCSSIHWAGHCSV